MIMMPRYNLHGKDFLPETHADLRIFLVSLKAEVNRHNKATSLFWTVGFK